MVKKNGWSYKKALFLIDYPPWLNFKLKFSPCGEILSYYYLSLIMILIGGEYGRSGNSNGDIRIESLNK